MDHKGKLLIALFMIVASLMLSACTLPVSAGVEPSPFHQEVNKLGSVVNNLNSIDSRVENVLSKPANYGEQGTVNKLDSMAGKLGNLESRVESIGDDVGDGIGSDLVVREAFEDVRGAAQGIGDRIDTFMREGAPSEEYPDFITALEQVSTAAQDIVVLVNGLIGTPESIPV